MHIVKVLPNELQDSHSREYSYLDVSISCKQTNLHSYTMMLVHHGNRTGPQK